MPLDHGTRVGSYERFAKRGEGRMREVYRADDTQLDRDVTIKILPKPEHLPHWAGAS